MYRRAMVLLTVACTAGIMPAATQVSGEHRGYWLSFGGGGGWMGSDRTAATYVRMGGTPHNYVQFGAQVQHWWHDDDVQHTQVTVTTAVFPLYSARGGLAAGREWFLRGGFGVAAAHSFNDEDMGIGLDIGSGFNLRMGRNFFLTPNLDFLVDFYTDKTSTSLLFTLGFSWH